MGCIFSSNDKNNGGDEEGKPKGKLKRRGTYILTTNDGKYKTSAHQKEFVASNWEDDTKAIWDRPLSSLSCHMDLPRLGAKMKVYYNDELVEEENDSNKMQVVQNIILHIAESCGESPQLIDTIRNRYFEFVHEDGSGDVSQQLKSFLEEVIPEDTKLCNILSLCHQKIVFPAYYSIKKLVHDDLPFKDSRGSWQINVFITPDTCRVVHSKIQMAKDNVMNNEEPEFSFTWELIVVLQGSHFDTIRDVYVRIPEITTRPNLSPARAQEIRGIFEKNYPNDS